jgi:hypothetical protein
MHSSCERECQGKANGKKKIDGRKEERVETYRIFKPDKFRLGRNFKNFWTRRKGFFSPKVGDYISFPLNENEFLLAALREQKRTDGRGIYDVRSIDLAFGLDYGQVQVQLGRTR